MKGKIKEEVGKVTNDPNLEVSGNAEKNIGKVQQVIGSAEKAVGE
ncbi:MAG: CsbD family protein [Terriglobales bacterium]